MPRNVQTSTSRIADSIATLIASAPLSRSGVLVFSSTNGITGIGIGIWRVIADIGAEAKLEISGLVLGNGEDATDDAVASRPKEACTLAPSPSEPPELEEGISSSASAAGCALF